MMTLPLPLLLLLLAACPAAAAAEGFWTGCDTVVSPLDNRTTGTDYIGSPNISVIAVNSSQECCDACRSQTTPQNCTVAIWHNLVSGGEGLCVLKAELGRAVKGVRVAACRPTPLPPPPPSFRFSGAHSDHMVLQAAPDQAAVWGFCPPGDAVTVRFDDKALPATLSTVNGSTLWTVALPATAASFTSHTIDAHSKLSGQTISLEDVLFGDVWVCSGQSNSAHLNLAVAVCSLALHDSCAPLRLYQILSAAFCCC